MEVSQLLKEEVDYGDIDSLESELHRLCVWRNRYNSKGADSQIESLKKRIADLKAAKGIELKEVKILESLTNKKVTLKEASVSPSQVGAGDLINTKYGRLIVLQNPKRGPVWVVFAVVEENKMDSYLKGVKPIQVQTYKVKWNTSIDKSGVIPKEKVKKLFDIYLGKAAEID
jgi:hypothetical protein